MFKEIHFLTSVFELNDLPESDLPQLILCGRSNVGKSSFINSISNRKGLAKTSSTPGKTRSINFYKADNTFFMVDLPGFGYAKTSQKEREKWGKPPSGMVTLAITEVLEGVYKNQPRMIGDDSGT